MGGYHTSAARVPNLPAPGGGSLPACLGFTYDPVGNRIHKTLPGGAYTDYTYNSRNLLTLLENRKSDQSLLSSFAYGLDYVGNRTSMTEGDGDLTTLLMAPGR